MFYVVMLRYVGMHYVTVMTRCSMIQYIRYGYVTVTLREGGKQARDTILETHLGSCFIAATTMIYSPESRLLSSQQCQSTEGTLWFSNYHIA